MSEVHESLTEDSFDLMEYLTSGTIAKRQVTIYNDPEAGDLLVSTLERLAELGWSEDDEQGGEPVDGPLSDADDEPDPEVAELLEVAQEAQERLEASKSVWTVRALSEEEAEATFEAVPLPKMPMPPKDNSPEKDRLKFARQAQEYGSAKVESDRKRKLLQVAAAVVSVERGGRSVDSVSVEMLEALRTRPQGEQWIDKLAAALNEAQKSDPDVPRPTSLGRSTNIPG